MVVEHFFWKTAKRERYAKLPYRLNICLILNSSELTQCLNGWFLVLQMPTDSVIKYANQVIYFN